MAPAGAGSRPRTAGLGPELQPNRPRPQEVEGLKNGIEDENEDEDDLERGRQEQPDRLRGEDEEFARLAQILRNSSAKNTKREERRGRGGWKMEDFPSPHFMDPCT